MGIGIPSLSPPVGPAPAWGEPGSRRVGPADTGRPTSEVLKAIRTRSALRSAGYRGSGRPAPVKSDRCVSAKLTVAWKVAVLPKSCKLPALLSSGRPAAFGRLNRAGSIASNPAPVARTPVRIPEGPPSDPGREKP